MLTTGIAAVPVRSPGPGPGPGPGRVPRFPRATRQVAGPGRGLGRGVRWRGGNPEVCDWNACGPCGPCGPCGAGGGGAGGGGSRRLAEPRRSPPGGRWRGGRRRRRAGRARCRYGRGRANRRRAGHRRRHRRHRRRPGPAVVRRRGRLPRSRGRPLARIRGRSRRDTAELLEAPDAQEVGDDGSGRRTSPACGGPFPALRGLPPEIADTADGEADGEAAAEGAAPSPGSPDASGPDVPEEAGAGASVVFRSGIDIGRHYARFPTRMTTLAPPRGRRPATARTTSPDLAPTAPHVSSPATPSP